MKIPRTRTASTAWGALALGLTALVVAGCAPASGAAATGDATAEVTELRLGYFANVTHAPALIGVAEGLFDDALGDIDLKAEVFNAGPAAVEALSAGAIDAAYLGPNPAINTFIQSGGLSARVVAGAASGGAALVVRDGIDSPDDLAGALVASPQLGNTQDVALRSWLADQGFETSTTGSGDVSVTPTDNAQILSLFGKGRLDGAWVPEPWASRLVLEAGAHVLVDEAELWPEGAFPTTVLLVRADFAAQHPEAVGKLIDGHIAAVAWLGENPGRAHGAINNVLEGATGRRLTDEVLDRALQNVTFSVDPRAGTFTTLLGDGQRAGVLKDGSIEGLFDLRALNARLTEAGDETVSAAGLGEQ